MILRELLDDIGGVPHALLGDDRLQVGGITADSRAVNAGDLFVALPGTRTNGGLYIGEACRRGARVIAGDPTLGVPAGVAFIASTAPGQLLAHLAAGFHGHPAASLTMVGVTGTNGKTTVTYLLESIWIAAGWRPGVLGTISYRYGGTAEPAPLTTPPACELFARLAAMRAAGATHVAMEVSSHALAQGRAEGVEWDAAIFTNLGRDHLDYHRDHDQYFLAKTRLFHALDASPKAVRVAVLNAADLRVAGLGSGLRSRVVTFGEGGNVRAESVEMTPAGTTAVIVLGDERLPVRTSLLGTGHLENVLAAAAAAYALGAPPEAIARGIASLPRVPGRLERVSGDEEFTVLVDFAHTPDALAGVLASLRALVSGRLICVFGCGGDRDRGKRPLMGRAVGKDADVAVLTSDNPRTEDPYAIIAEAEAGLVAAAMPRCADLTTCDRGYIVLEDRAQAIASAIGCARPGDCVVIAGKGHEDYQIIGTEKRPFDDHAVVRRVLGERRRWM